MSDIVQFETPKSVEEAVETHSKITAIEEVLHVAGNYEGERHAARARLKAERFIGTELQKLGLSSRPGAGARKGSNRGGSTRSNDHELPEWYSRISKDQRSWWQLIALIPEKKFNEYLVDPSKGALERSKRLESGIPTTKGFVKLALPYKPKPKERPERKLSADQLAKIEEKQRLAAIKDQQRRVMQAHARSEQSSQRLVNRTFLLVKKMTSDERKSLLQMIEDRADELIEDSTWAAAS
jgi:hypothetical protein